MSSQENNKRLRWGVLGCARVAEAVLIPGIQRSRNGTVSAVASRDLDRARGFAEKFSIGKAYGSYEKLLGDAEIEAVYIPLPNGLHKEWTIRAAREGKHVLCEKALACSAEEAQEMVDACRKNSVLLMEAFAHRFHPQNRLVKKLVSEGRIGKVLGMISTHSVGPHPSDNIRLNRELGGGVLGDLGCYCLDTARFLLENEPTSVFAKIEFGEESSVDERATVTLHFPDDSVVYFDSSFRLAPGTYCGAYEVLGEGGQIYVPKAFAQLDTYRLGKIVDTYFFVRDNAIPGQAESKTQRIDVEGIHQWQLEAEHFADTILAGEELEFPAENGLGNSKVLDAIYQSAKGGRPVGLGDGA